MGGDVAAINSYTFTCCCISTDTLQKTVCMDTARDESTYKTRHAADLCGAIEIGVPGDTIEDRRLANDVLLSMGKEYYTGPNDTLRSVILKRVIQVPSSLKVVRVAPNPLHADAEEKGQLDDILACVRKGAESSVSARGPRARSQTP